MIQAKAVKKIYCGKNNSKNVILDNLNFEISDGEFVCLIGMSGCGKSTLLRLLSGLESPSDGVILSDGEAVKGPLKDGAFVFQDYALFPWRTVLENVEFGAKINHIYSKQELRKTAEEYLERIHLLEYKDAYIHQLSGGMKQRVAIARALIMKPNILFMDEPFGALDSFTRMELQVFLKEIVEESGVSVVFVTHDIDEAIFLADRIDVMNKNSGKIDHAIPIQFEGIRDRTNGEFEQYRETIFETFHLTRTLDIEYQI